MKHLTLLAVLLTAGCTTFNPRLPYDDGYRGLSTEDVLMNTLLIGTAVIAVKGVYDITSEDYE